MSFMHPCNLNTQSIHKGHKFRIDVLKLIQQTNDITIAVFLIE